ncbi:protein pangolin, isoforms A/H/I/S-like isoform X2 [Oratosquilla oratoria]|uniref:protein pangolin, isoforms A/H/I/S-like isoform X2 n=1 Tax=Oratosquilla oratoria TaxID=337810 RepID=UPI003F765EC1
MGFGAGPPGSSLFSLYHNGQHLGQPPPAHMGISPYQLDPKASLRPPMYPFAASGQYPYPLGADFTAQMASAWPSPSMFPLSPSSAFRSPYSSSLPIPSATTMPRFSPSGLMAPHPGLTPPLSHPLVPSPKTDLPNTSHDNHRLSWLPACRHPGLMDQKPAVSSAVDNKTAVIETKNGDKKPHIKKPLNAFMLYMKEMRAKVVAECTLKESAAINQILGRKWHALSKEEQAKYYEMARRERQLHMQMYPGWNARDNYGMMKKKKRKKEKTGDGANMKKCRARYGLEQQSQWCKPCRRKKKCIRYMEGEDTEDQGIGSAGSVEGIGSPESEDDDDDQEDLGSPSMILPHDVHMSSPSSSFMPSPGPSLASPSGPPSLLMPSPASLASPLTPGESKDHPMPLQPGCQLGQQQLQQQEQQQQQQQHVVPPRAPVGTNPRDINNPLSVNQLTGQCAANKPDSSGQQDSTQPTMVSVT